MLYFKKGTEIQNKEIFMAAKINESQVDKMPLLRYFLFFFIPPAILIALILSLFYRLETRADMAKIQAAEAHILEMEEVLIIDEFKLVLSDLFVLAGQHGLEEMPETGKTAEVIDNLTRDYLILSDKKRVYDQIRILDKKGMEIVRVNFNGGEPASVAEDQLQNKGNRYYFSETFRLDRGDVYVSPFDLNIERGEIERPLKPMIRFGTPFFDRQGDKQGIVILNYLGASLLNKFESAAENSVGKVMILNADGFWLKGPNSEDEWGFMYEEGKERTFGRKHPGAWSEISGADSGQFQNAVGLFSFTTLYPLREIYKAGMMHEVSGEPDRAYHWKIVSHVPTAVLKEKRDKLFGELFLFYAVLIVLTTIACWFLSHLTFRRRHAVKELVKSEERYELAEFAGNIGSWDWNILAGELCWTENIEPVFGFGPGEFGATYEAFIESVHPDDRKFVIDSINAAVEEGKDYAIEHRIVWPNKSIRWVSETGAVFKDEKGKAIRMLGIVQDITRHKLSEEELNHKRRLAAMGEMSAHLAHEIRNPLNTVGISYEALSGSEDLTTRDREIVEIMGHSLETLYSLAMDLLDYGKAGKLSRKIFDGPELIEAVLSDLKTKIANNAVEVTKDFPGKSLPLNADRVKIRQVFTNLIDNALEAMPEGGKLTIMAAEVDGRFVVNVSDTGIGMASEDLEKIFDPFFTTKQEGTGLGMAILEHFVELHGGEVSVESEPGKGTTVTVILPLQP